MATVDNLIAKEYDTLRQQLVGQFFEYGWELLAFAGALGWDLQHKAEVPDKGSIVKTFSDSDRGDSLLVDLLALVSHAKKEDESPDDGVAAMQCLDDDKFNDRCKELTAYANGGLEYVQKVHETTGMTYSEVVLNIVEDGADPTVIRPLG